MLRIIQCSAYHGVLAPCASARDRIVPGPRRPSPPAGLEDHVRGDGTTPGLAGGPSRAPEAQRLPEGSARIGAVPTKEADCASDLHAATSAGVDRAAATHPHAGAGHRGPRRLPWAELLQRVFGLDALRCPRCGAGMRVVAAIEEPEVARRILECLDLPARAPPLGPAADGLGWQDGESSDPSPPWTFDQTPAFDPTAPGGDDAA